VPPQAHVVGVDLSTVTGAIVLRMAFDDATNLLTTSFSLDGGTTFQSPFPPLPTFNVIPDGEILLGANAVAVDTPPPPPPSSPICPGVFPMTSPRLELRRLGPPAGDEQLQLKTKVQVHPAAIFPIDPVANGALFLVEDYGATPTSLFDVLPIPAGATGSGCDPRDGWRGKNGDSSYRNVSGAFPPACVPGSAKGLQRVRIRDRQLKNGTIAVNLVAKSANIPSPAYDEVRVGFVFGGASQAGLGCAAGRGSGASSSRRPPATAAASSANRGVFFAGRSIFRCSSRSRSFGTGAGACTSRSCAFWFSGNAIRPYEGQAREVEKVTKPALIRRGPGTPFLTAPGCAVSA